MKSKYKSRFIVSVRSLLKLNLGNKIHLGSLKAVFVKVSQNFTKSHLKFCLISQISAHSLWHVFWDSYGNNFLGPVVQSIVSLTSWLRGQLAKCFMTL